MSESDNYDFAELIANMSNGAANRQITDALRDVVKAVEETGKAGDVVIKLTIKHEKARALIVLDVKNKIPREAVLIPPYYYGVNGELLEEDPRQVSMVLDVPKNLRMRT